MADGHRLGHGQDAHVGQADENLGNTQLPGSGQGAAAKRDARLARLVLDRKSVV